MVSNKPAAKPSWIPDNTTNITDPGALKTNGFIGGTSKIVANYNNYLFNILSQWTDYTDRNAVNTIYLEGTSGNDTTGDGSSSSPFKTLDKAFTEIEKHIQNQNIIHLAEAGTYELTSNVELSGQRLKITGITGTDILFKGYQDVLIKNNLRKISLDQSHLHIAVDCATDAPSSSSNDWGANVGAITVGTNSTAFVRGTVTGSATAGFSGNPNFFACTADATVGIDGDVTTNSELYIFQTYTGAPYNIQGSIKGTVDDSDYIKKGGLPEQAMRIVSGDNTTAIESASNIDLQVWGSNVSAYTTTVAKNANDASVTTAFSTLFNQNFPGTPFTVSVACSRTVPVTGDITGFTIDITVSDVDDEIDILPTVVITYSGDTHEGFFRRTRRYRPASHNIVIFND